MRTKLWLSGLGVLAIAPSGCGPVAPQPADHEAARDALRTALDAWKKGDPPDSLAQAQPPIHVSDWRWRSGVKLVRYQIDEGDQTTGAERRCPVQLWIDAGAGKTIQETTVYGVATHPALTVSRQGDH
jgi:hypothetical protein